jgi:hypothetical protein
VNLLLKWGTIDERAIRRNDHTAFVALASIKFVTTLMLPCVALEYGQPSATEAAGAGGPSAWSRSSAPSGNDSYDDYALLAIISELNGWLGVRKRK